MSNTTGMFAVQYCCLQKYLAHFGETEIAHRRIRLHPRRDINVVALS